MTLYTVKYNRSTYKLLFYAIFLEHFIFSHLSYAIVLVIFEMKMIMKCTKHTIYRLIYDYIRWTWALYTNNKNKCYTQTHKNQHVHRMVPTCTDNWLMIQKKKKTSIENAILWCHCLCCEKNFLCQLFSWCSIKVGRETLSVCLLYSNDIKWWSSARSNYGPINPNKNGIDRLFATAIKTLSLDVRSIKSTCDSHFCKFAHSHW